MCIRDRPPAVRGSAPSGVQVGRGSGLAIVRDAVRDGEGDLRHRHAQAPRDRDRARDHAVAEPQHRLRDVVVRSGLRAMGTP
eukprot:16440510-Heterocapsa_arctica.AAC.1